MSGISAEQVELHNDVRLDAVTSAPGSHFFGYYDKCPWDIGGDRLLAVKVPFDSREPGPDDVAEIGVVHLADGNRFEKVAETRAWNFQTGCMLQWHPRYPSKVIVFNDRVDDRFVGVLFDLETGERQELPGPVAALSRDGRYALGVNFARLFDMRPGYGYAGVPDPWANERYPEQDGIYLIDLETREQKLIVSLAAAANLEMLEENLARKQWFNMPMFNTNDTRFCFLHRWWDDGESLHSRLLTANIDGTDVYCLEDSGVFSHYDWQDETRLLAWSRKKSAVGGGAKRKLVKLADHPLFGYPPFNTLLRMLRRGAIGWVRQNVVGDRFALYEDRSRSLTEIGKNVLREDGHCSFSPDRWWVLMDLYPHEDRMTALLLYDIKANRVVQLGKFYSMPELTGPVRCDLHATWNRDGTQVCIDSTHTGNRQVYVLDVSSIVRA